MAIIKHSRKVKSLKKKSIFYEAQVYVRGVRVAIKTFETQAEAAKWHDEIKRQYTSGQVADRVAAELSFGEVFER